jgi:serine/threonine protein kinase
MSGDRWRRIEEIFHQAVELAPEARSAFLSEVCGGDESMRQEVASLLAHEAEDGRTFVGPAEEDVGAGTGPQSIAHYRISGKLGEGGMGAVYRATDTKLDREVAIKVLPEALAGDPNRMARFTREAKVLASLNHPNIAAIYGVEERALVMELVNGEDLRGPLPLATVLHYARQIADALDAAHEKGIVHRDLKPANIRITSDGMVKVLDFGLAKIAESAEIPHAAGDSPSAAVHATGTGAIIGTAAYMAPEQARGQAVDKRADIWAFGVVVYELLTGKMLFGGEGKNVSDSLAAVLTQEPDFDALPKDTPPRVRRLLERCLRKDSKLRLRDIGEARILLDEAEPEVPASARRWIPWTIAGVLGVALLASGGGWLRRQASEPGPGAARFLLPLPPGTSGTAHIMSTQAVPSPDGRYLAITARDSSSGKQGLWVRPLGSAAAQRLDNTEGASVPFWSPDSQYIGFFADDKLKRVAVSGGSVQTICEVPYTSDGGTWNQEGVIVYATYGPGAQLMRVPAAGGVPTAVTTLEKDESWHCWPQFLPDGRHLLYFAVHKEAANGAIYVLEPGSTKRALVLKNTTRGVWAAPGYLLFVREGTLFAQRMDAKTFQLEGAPVAVAEDVAFNAGNGRNAIAASQNGVLVYRGNASTRMRQLAWYDRAGKPLGTAGKPGEFLGPSLSPDEKSVAMLVGPSGKIDIWVMDLASGVMTRMTHDSLVSIGAPPLWSPDSQRLAVTQVITGIQEVAVASGKVTPLTRENVSAQDWSPDGSSILCTQGTGHFQLLMAGGARLQTIGDTHHGMGSLRFSPDGHYVVYVYTESGQAEVYAASFPGFAAKRKISSGGGRFPVWAKDGKEILYRAADGALMSAAIRTGSNLVAGTPKLLFKDAGSDSGLFSVTADGRRFLINEAAQKNEGEKPDITVVLNWTAGIR